MHVNLFDYLTQIVELNKSPLNSHQTTKKVTIFVIHHKIVIMSSFLNCEGFLFSIEPLYYYQN